MEQCDWGRGSPWGGLAPAGLTRAGSQSIPLELSKDTILNIYVLYVLHFPTEPDFTSKSDTTMATKPAIVPGSRLMPSKPPSAGTMEVVSNEPSQVPPQTTAKILEHTPSTSQEMPG